MVALRVLAAACAVALFSTGATGLKIDAARAQHAAKVAPVAKVAASEHAVKSDSKPPTQADVDSLHKRLEDLVAGMQGMLSSDLGKTAKARVGSGLEQFVKELQKMLVETKGMKDPVAAMKKLEVARDSVGSMISELTSQQESLMKEQEDRKDSLLLGELMIHQKDTLANQLEVLKRKDFADLEVSKALLAKHDEKTALFKQAGAYLDQHVSKAEAHAIVGNATVHAQIEEKIQAREDAAAKSFQKRIDSMQKVYDAREKQHKKRMHELNEAMAKAGKKSKHAMQAMLKREERTFKKWSAMQKHDIDSMKSAVKAMKSGDLNALAKAKTALEESLKSLQSKNGGFLVLMQLGNAFMDRDCPYCAAQCVDTCHQAGKPYMTCLTDCADSGKGK